MVSVLLLYLVSFAVFSMVLTMAANMLIHISMVPSTRDRLPLELSVDSMFS